LPASLDVIAPSRINGPGTSGGRVTYWTGIWEPRREALSKEVAWLRRELAPSGPVVSFTPQSSRVMWSDRVLRINVHRWVSLCTAAVVIERLGDVTHVFGGLDAAHFLYVLGRRPILFTVAIPGQTLAPAMYDRVARFVAESRTLASALREAGVPSDRIDVIYPAVDISRFAPHPPPAAEPFRLLFASTPSEPDDIESRGIGLLIELAQARPEIEVVVLWRQWGRLLEARRALDRMRPPVNFRVEQRDVADMSTVYPEMHATVCCFAKGVGKSAPNSVIEGLASGRPALLTDTCGLADVVDEWGAGVVVPRTLAGLASGIDQLRHGYSSMRIQARRLAEAELDDTRALARYSSLYASLAGSR
jgi:glycosyltransferase involved in cell wall biosynthesis